MAVKVKRKAASEYIFVQVATYRLQTPLRRDFYCANIPTIDTRSRRHTL
jgi:hypothetical protein